MMPRLPRPLMVALVMVSTIVASCGTASTPTSGSGLAGELFDVGVLSATEAWAVGDFFPIPSDIGDFKAITEHFHGRKWSRVSSPSPPSYKAQLTGVAATSSGNAWAVGYYNARTGNDRTLIERWDGKRWKIVSSPNPGTYGNVLVDISAVSATDVWAVGFYGRPKALVVHWTGSGWKRVSIPDPNNSQGTVLSAVSARSKNDVWAVGTYVSNSVSRTLIQHWDGHAWKTTPSVDPSKVDNELTGVNAISVNDVWAVGYSTTPSGDRPLIEHWDGNTWSQVAAAPSGQSALVSVGGVSSTDVWAVGSAGTGSVKTLIEHWNGTKWSVVRSPNRSQSENELLGVSVRTGSDVWAVGYFAQGSSHKTLIEHWNGTSWSVK